ncbi:Mur ligase family protein [Nocardioides terrisoli]|uniref:Mur ligase family protein n=1 Tax=Nocardioides terrisoli TaxID=3388267 RepID=UPI00287B638A|nr:Mur ligase family protein [Nocardioides marmorisolisilvae]
MTSLVELRVLEGPNLYFPRAAIKVTVDVTEWAGADVDPFAAPTLMRRLAGTVRELANRAGTHRLAVRVRPTRDPHVFVVAYPWRHRDRARALGEAVAAVLDGSSVEAAAAEVTRTLPGPAPTTIRPRVPVVAVTGTNGKTTTSRMIAHIARTEGHLVGWSNTDGVYVDGVLVEPGDYSGPSGAGRVLAHPEVDFAVTETARGGILLKGIGVLWNDVSVVTNVTADHLGLQGIDTVDQLAEVKSVVPRITRRAGWAVLNADDPRVLAMRAVTKARPWLFTRDPDSPAVREVLNAGGRATTVVDGWIVVRDPGVEPLLELADVPMTLAGLSHFNVENALAATSAALAAGIGSEHVVAGLRSFRPDAEHNPGRMNVFSLDGRTVVMDLAHNEAGLAALVEILRGLRTAGGRLLLGLGAVGDRTDELVEMLGEIGARDSDEVVIGHKEHYLRGRTTEELDALFRAGAARVGVGEVPAYPTELAALQELVRRSRPGDVIGLMCHAEREQVHQWIIDQGGTADAPEVLREKVRAATGGTDVPRSAMPQIDVPRNDVP